MQGDNQDFWEKVKKAQLPRPPSVALKLLELTRSGADLRKPAELITSDPTLAAEILTIVNSPWFGLKKEVTSIVQAVVLLGADTVCSLASSFSMRDTVNEFDQNGFDYSSYWRRSVLAAIAARVMAREVRLDNREEVFLAALLQDIGMLVLVKAFPDVYPGLLEEAAGNHICLQELERERLRTDHIQMGVHLQKTWGLPEVFPSAVQGSHDPNQAEVDDCMLPSMKCVALSGPIADIWEDPDTSQASLRAYRMAVGLSEMDVDQLQAILVAVANDFCEASQMFKVSGGDSDRIQAVLAKVGKELEQFPSNQS